MLDSEDKAPQVILPNDDSLGMGQISFNEPVEPKEKPTFFETGKANARLFNDIVRSYNWIADNAFPSAFEDTTDKDGYNPIKAGLVDKVRPEDQLRVIQTDSLREGQTMVRRIHEEYNDKDVRDRSGWFANLVTTLGAGIISPTTLIPLSQTVKYATVGAGAFKNAMNVSKSLVPAIALQNAVLVGTKETEDYKDWVHDTLVESFIGAGIGGALGAFAAKGVDKQFKTVKAVFKAVEDDVGIRYKVNEKGAAIDIEAFAVEGGSASAAHVKNVNDILQGVKPLENNPYTKKFTSWAHPIVEGLTSRFSIIRELTDDLFAHNFSIAGGESRAIRDASAENFKRSWHSKYDSLAIEQKQDWLKDIGAEGFLKETRGVTGEWTGKYISQKEFGEKVGKSIRRNGETGQAHVDASAKRWIKEFYDPLWDELKKRRPDLTEHEFTNIKRYLNRIYDKDLIQQDPVGFLSDLVGHMSKVNNEVRSMRAPLDSLRKQNKQLLDKINVLKQDLTFPGIGTAEKKTIREQIEQLRALRGQSKAKIDAFHAELDKKIFAGEIDISHLAEKPNLKPEQAKAIKQFEDTLAQFQKQVEEAQRHYKELGRKGKPTPELSKRREDARKTLKQKKHQLATHKKRVRDIINQEGFDQSLVWYDRKGETRLKKLNKPRLANVLEQSEIDKIAKMRMDTILQQNEDQMVGQIFNSIADKNPNILKERTILWNDEQAERWLINDTNVLGGVYMNQMINRIHLDDVLRKYSGVAGDPAQGKLDIVNYLKRDYEEQRNPLLKQERTKDVQKKIDKLDKDYDKAKKYIENMYKTFLGDFGDRSAVSFRITNSLKEMAVATMLGNLPILQLPEFFTPLFKFTFSEYIQDGLFPMLRYWNELKRTGQVDRAAFQDVGVGLNVALGKRLQAMFGYGAQGQPKTFLERYIKNMAGLSNNLSMANHITDFQETMVAFMSQAKSLRVLEKFEKGEALSAKDVARFDEIRLNPHKYGKQILEQVKKHGEKFEGGVVANWHLWDKEAFEAQQAFKISIEKDTRAIITKPNALDMPFGFKDNILASLATQFLSFPFSATLNFTIPILTKPDAQKFTGMLLTMAGAAMVDPLRQLAKGEEVEIDFQKLATSAFTNSGFFGWQADALQRVNSALDLPFMRPFQGDRFRKKDPWSLLGGPSAGMLGDLATTLSALANGDITKSDASKIFRYMVPFSGSWYLRQPVSAMIDSIGLSETREPRG